VNGPVFRFRLERVRALRERKEQQAQQELAQAISLRSGAEAELQAAEAELERARSEQRALTSEPQALAGGEFVARQAFLEHIEGRRGAQAQELEQRKAAVVERDATLTTAATEHETLKRLRERQHGEHQRAIAGREQSELDEIAAARFGRSGT
jgi:flagellar export protein FliJ